MASILFQRFKF